VTGRIVVDTRAGNDRITLTAAVRRRTQLDGGDGDDTINGGGAKDFIIGGLGNDVINGRHGNDVLIGGDGDDSIIGGRRRDLLIGGIGLDILSGGNQSDILIGGTTAFDEDLAALDALMREWSQTAVSYAARIRHLLGTQSGGMNGTVLLTNDPAATVFDDGLANRLTGGLSLDWFFQGALDLILDLNNGGAETVTNLP
jgi:Ca2+-binding RTX toxin-like protein